MLYEAKLRQSFLSSFRAINSKWSFFLRSLSESMRYGQATRKLGLVHYDHDLDTIGIATARVARPRAPDSGAASREARGE